MVYQFHTCDYLFYCSHNFRQTSSYKSSQAGHSNPKWTRKIFQFFYNWKAMSSKISLFVCTAKNSRSQTDTVEKHQVDGSEPFWKIRPSLNEYLLPYTDPRLKYIFDPNTCFYNCIFLALLYLRSAKPKKWGHLGASVWR